MDNTITPAVIRNKWISSIICIITYILTSVLVNNFDFKTGIIFLNIVNIYTLIVYIKSIIFLVRYSDNILSPSNTETNNFNKILKAFYFILNGIMSVYMIYFITQYIYICSTENCFKISNIGSFFTVIYNMFTTGIMIFMLTQLSFFTFLPSCVWLIPNNIGDNVIDPITIYDKKYGIIILIYSCFVLFLNFAIVFNTKLTYTELVIHSLIYRICYASYLGRSSIEYEIETFRSAILWGMTCILVLTSYVFDTIIFINHCNNKNNKNSCYDYDNNLFLLVIINQHVMSILLSCCLIYAIYQYYQDKQIYKDSMYERLLNSQNIIY